MQYLQSTLTEKINTALDQLGIERISFDLQHPADEAHGDYATNVAMKLFGHLKDHQILHTLIQGVSSSNCRCN